MSTHPPMQLLSLLRRIISELSLKRASTVTHSARSPGIFTSLLRAAAIPSLGYLFGWKSHIKAVYSSSDSTRVQNDRSSSPLGEKEGTFGKPSQGISIKEKSLGENEPIHEKYDVENVPKPPQYDPSSPIYRLMNNPALYNPTRKPRNPIVLAHGMLVYLFFTSCWKWSVLSTLLERSLRV